MITFSKAQPAKRKESSKQDNNPISSIVSKSINQILIERLSSLPSKPLRDGIKPCGIDSAMYLLGVQVSLVNSSRIGNITVQRKQVGINLEWVSYLDVGNHSTH